MANVNNSICPKIDVLHWDASQVHVKCPYCEEIHRHGLRLPGMRRSHCQYGGSYEFVLPIDKLTGLVGYEIDKRRKRFVNVAYEPSGSEEDSELANVFSSRMKLSDTAPKSDPTPNLDTDSEEAYSFTKPDGQQLEPKRIKQAISACVLGDVRAVSQYLENSTEAELFLHGTDGAGKTTLIMAAAERCPDMLTLLLNNGADTEATSNDGRTALMEAALWGRIDNVNILLKAGARKDPRDCDGRSAADLAQETRKNENERSLRYGRENEPSVLERNADRRRIAILLAEPTLTKDQNYSRPLTAKERAKYAFSKSKADFSITLHGPVRTLPVRSIYKTAAELDRGTQFSRVPATSGWAADALPPDYGVQYSSWVDQVFHIAAMVGHELVEDYKDQGQPGRFSACHAEKKLIAYFIDKHVFTRQERKRDRKLEATIVELEWKIFNARFTSPSWERMRTLEDKKEELQLELFDADDHHPDVEYDEAKVRMLKKQISVVETKIQVLEDNLHVAKIRAEQWKKGKLMERLEKHEELRKLFLRAPAFSLKSAVILSSNEICTDCESFKDKVNEHFGLDIQMAWVYLEK